eukprot:7714518-Lingulodinium_polyedra.AAC.1
MAAGYMGQVDGYYSSPHHRHTIYGYFRHHGITGREPHSQPDGMDMATHDDASHHMASSQRDRIHVTCRVHERCRGPPVYLLLEHGYA